MIGFSQPLSASARRGWNKFRIAEALGPGEHSVHVVTPGPPVLLDISGLDYDDQDRPSADIQAFHPDIDGIGWDDIWEAVRQQHPTSSLLPMATDAEYQAIKESIATFGSLQRVIVDESGNVIAGRLRKRACAELGVQCPTEVIAVTPDQSEQLAFELDFCRKHLSRDDKRNAAELLLKANPRNTDRQIGRACGLDHKTVGRIREDLEEEGELPQVEQRVGGDGKTYKFPRIVTNSEKEEDRAQAGLQVLGDDAPAKALDLRRAERLARIKNAQNRKTARTQNSLLPDDSIQILHSDFRNLEIEDNSVPLFLADPPYDRGSIGLYEDVARFAAQKLRPDGFLVAYTGIMYFPETIAVLTKHLTWVWKTVLIYPEASHYIQGRNAINMHRDIVIFSKGRTDLPVALRDVLFGDGRQKDFHEWQQDISGEIFFIENLTMPGELVVSPFGGGFTTAAACHRLGRRCLTCDIDADAVQRGMERLTQERQAQSS